MTPLNTSSTYPSGVCPDEASYHELAWAFLHGELDPGQALLVRTQFYLCPKAKERVLVLNQCSAASLESVEPVKMKCSARAFFEEKCCHKEKKKAEAAQDQTGSSVKEEIAKGIVPKPLRCGLGADRFDKVSWTTISDTVATAKVKVLCAASPVTLVKVKPGTWMPFNDTMMVLVLAGAVTASGKTCRPGSLLFDAFVVTQNFTVAEEAMLLVAHQKQSFLSRLKNIFTR